MTSKLPVRLGVHDAIKQMFLKRLYFGIAANAEGTKLLEASLHLYLPSLSSI